MDVDGFTSDFGEFIELLNKHKVKYMTIGAYARAAHGSPRFTGDVDFLIEVSEENAENMLNVLNEFGFASLGLMTKDFMDSDIIQLGIEPNRIDIHKTVPGVEFKEAYASAIRVNFEGIETMIIGKTDFIKSKLSSGRSQDIADVEALEDD